MKKRIFSAILVLALCFCLTLPAYAAPAAYVVDEVGYLSENEISNLNSMAAELYDTYGVGIFFVYSTIEWLKDYDISALTNGMKDYVVMMENDTSWFVFYGGKGEQIDLETEERLRAAYDAADTYAGGIRDFFKAAAACFTSDDTAAADDAGESFLFDEAYLLSEAEQAKLEARLQELSHTYQAQIVVATISSLDRGNMDQYVEYVYDSMGFGYGENHDGVFLLVCMNPREYRVLSNGFAGSAVDTDVIADAIVSDLSAGYYADAFDIFADQCAYYLDGHFNGFPFAFGKNLLICLVIGIVVGVIVAFVLKGQLKSVRKQDQANVYVKPDSMQITLQRDFFLYREVTRSKKESGSSSSRSGSSRSVSGGSF